ncbi:STAS domain-containing protein [Rhodococcus triatomae]
MRIRALHYQPLAAALDARSQTSPGVTVVEAVGAVDATAVNELATVLRRALDQEPSAVVVDLSHTDFLGISAAEVLLDAITSAERDGHPLALVPGNAAVTRTLDVTGVLARAELRASVQDAVDALRSTPRRRVP